MATYRTVTTNLTSDHDIETIKSVLGQMSDGYWENSSRMEAIWRNVSIARNDEGEIEFRIISGPMRWDIYKWTDDAIRKYFAAKIKQIVKLEAYYKPNSNYAPQWKRCCDMELDFFYSGLRVCDVYRTYDLLLGRPAHEYVN